MRATQRQTGTTSTALQRRTPDAWVVGLSIRVVGLAVELIPVNEPVVGAREMDVVRELAKAYNLIVIEDATEAHGAEYLTNRGREDESWVRAGGLCELGTFSFYANKLITTGEGGMVLTDDPSLADHLRNLRNMSYRTDRRFWHTELGYKFRMTNLQAAGWTIGLSSEWSPAA